MRGVTEEFNAIVGLDEPETCAPSQAARRLWVSVGDTYDRRWLYQLWRFHIGVYTRYMENVGPPLPVIQAMYALAAEIAAFSDQPAPAPEWLPGLQDAIDQADGSWLGIQAAYDSVADAWEGLGW